MLCTGEENTLKKKQLFDLEVKGQGFKKIIIAPHTPPYGHAPTYQISLTYHERLKRYGPEGETMMCHLNSLIFDLHKQHNFILQEYFINNSVVMAK